VTTKAGARTAPVGATARIPRKGSGVRELVVLAALVALTACTQPGSTPAPSPAPSVLPTPSTPVPSPRVAGPDFDGDGGADLVVGIGESPGRVSVRYANGTKLDFGRQEVDPTEEVAVDFGQVLLARDLDRDGFDDLVVSDPGLDPSLYWIYGTATGLDLTSRVVTRLGDLPGAGHSLALVATPKPVVVVGGGTSGSTGVVLSYELGADGRPTTEPARLTAEALGVPSLPAGSRFGLTLVATGSLLAIGAPGEPVGTARQAGAVYAIDFGDQPLHARRITQDTPGVPDTAQGGDRFGAALAAGDHYLAVGVPGEDRKDESGINRAQTGMVQVFRILDGGLQAGDALDQADLPGKLEPGDLFGSAVSMVRPCPGTTGVLVGASAEAIGSTQQAGAVWVVPLGATRECRAFQLYGGNRLGDKAEANTLIGSAVGALRGDAGGDTLVLVAQGNWEEGVAGRVLTLDHPYTGAPVEVLGNLAISEERTIALSPVEG